jgi:hypothetical protein
MEWLQEFIAHPLVAGTLSGFTAAALVDYQAFRSWKSAEEARSYGWGVAAWRWFQGAVGGFVAALGIQGLT